MAEAREELVVSGVGCTPPALVLIELIQLGGARYIEWRDAHQAIGYDGSRVSRTEVRGPDEGIDFIMSRLELCAHALLESMRSDRAATVVAL